MPGALSTLGLGSKGVLTNDILDQLKEADKSSTVKPIERRQKLLTQKQEGLKSIKDAFAELTKLSTSLTDIALYDNKTSKLSGDSVSLSVTDKSVPQAIDIDVSVLATRDIQSAAGMVSKDSALNADSFNIDIDGKSFDISVSSSDTLEDIMKNINKNTDGKITASILNVGGDTPYQLILKSTDTGAKNAITVTPTGDATKTDLGISRLGDAPIDAQLTVDGISITSASNTLDELLEGSTITLEKTGATHINVSYDNENVVEKMGEFVEKYNELFKTINDLTKFNSEQKTAGVLQDSRDIKNIKSTLTNVFTTTLSSGGKNIEDFGISIKRDGTASLNTTKLKEVLESDTQSVKDFFIGADATSGVLSRLDSAFFDINTSSSGALKSLKSNFDEQNKSLTASLEKANARLSSKYAILQRQFAAYDAVIGRLSNSADTISSLIEAQYANN